MFGALRRSVATGSRRFDRHQRVIEGHVLRSLRSNANVIDGGVLAQRSYSHYNGAHATIGVQRIIEGLAGSSSASREDQDFQKNGSSKRSLHVSGQPSLRNVSAGKSASFYQDLLLPGIRMPRSAMSLDVLRPSVELMKSSMSSPFSMRTTHLPTTPLGMIGGQAAAFSSSRHLIASSSHRSPAARRYFSSEQGNSPKSQYKTSAKIPTPKSAPNNSMFSFASFDPKALLKGLWTTTWSITKMVLSFMVKLPKNTIFYIQHPKERREKIQEIKGHAQKEFDHYWTGTKLLMADVRTARDLVRRTLTGSTLTRRERKQLLRTVTDLFRLVPFSMFLIVPAAEFALPFALRIFPNMLPSTFQDSLKAEENMKRELQSRIAMAHFFQETLEELAKEQKRIAAKRNVESPDNEIANKQEQSAASMLEFLDRARQGEMVPPDVIVQYAKYFQDDLTLDNMPRMQLVNMCRYMQLQPYGADSFLRFQLRHRIRQLKEDDQRIIWEGINSLTKMELREACQERGMRSTGLSKEAYKRSLQQWLDLSVHKNVPISLLIMSRTFFLQEEMTPAAGDEEAKSVASLADAISGMDKEVLNEVILEVATQEEKKSNPDIRKIKLEVVTQQNERIREEREAAEKKKKASERTESHPPEEPLAAVELELSKEQAEKLAQVVGAHRNGRENLVLQTKEIPTPGERTREEVEEAVASVDDERDHELSPAEMDAISQLLSADPVSKEREELARIKSAMSEKEADDKPQEEPPEPPTRKESGAAKVEEAFKSSMESPAALDDKQAASTIEKMEKAAADEADKSTVFSTETEMSPPNEGDAGSDDQTEEEEEEEHTDDPVVARLKQRLESMVDKIELQLSDVEEAIGDKLHILDKDADGVLSREEMAECLHLVLKREITFDEALEIADTIDENKDGVFTVPELISWIETSKLVKLESEGRDADMDRIMERASSDNTKDDTAKDGKKSESKP